jgi:hypothetical protein
MNKRKNIRTTPLTNWLLNFVDEHETNLTELAVKAGLSAGSLRALVKYPERIPALETCLRLSKATGKPVDEILQMARLNGVSTEQLDLDRTELLRIYQSLPQPAARILINLARALETSLLLELK